MTTLTDNRVSLDTAVLRRAERMADDALRLVIGVAHRQEGLEVKLCLSVARVHLVEAQS